MVGYISQPYLLLAGSCVSSLTCCIQLWPHYPTVIYLFFKKIYIVYLPSVISLFNEPRSCTLKKKIITLFCYDNQTRSTTQPLYSLSSVLDKLSSFIAAQCIVRGVLHTSACLGKSRSLGIHKVVQSIGKSTRLMCYDQCSGC